MKLTDLDVGCVASWPEESERIWGSPFRTASILSCLQEAERLHRDATVKLGFIPRDMIESSCASDWSGLRYKAGALQEGE